MIELIVAAILLISMYLSMAGFTFANYILLALVSLQIAVLTIGAVSLFTMDIEEIKDVKDRAKEVSRGIGIRFLMQFFYMAVCFYLFQIGYIFISGLLALSLAISFLATVVDFIKGDYP